jgi:hypothetical protein
MSPAPNKVALLAQDGGDGLFLGEDFFPWMVLAFGAAMVVGNALALLRPPQASGESAPGPPPLGRSVVMILIGLAASAWGLASLLG